MQRMSTHGMKHVESFFTRRWVWVCIGLAALAAILIGWSANGATSETPVFSPSALVEDYRSNDLLTTFAYEDNRIIVSGVVQECGSDAVTPLNAERPYLLIGDDIFSDSSAQVKCYFAPDDAEELESLAPHSPVSVEGTLLGSTIIPHLSSCNLVNAQ